MQVVRNIDRREIHNPAPQQAPGERRGTVRAMAAWAGLGGTGGIPVLANLRDCHRVIAAQEFLLKTDPIPGLSVFILCGDALRAILGRSALGTTLRDCMPDAACDSLARACATAVKQGAPALDEGAFRTGAGAQIRYRGVFMPLRSTGHADPEYLFGAYGCRTFGAAAPAAA